MKLALLLYTLCVGNTVYFVPKPAVSEDAAQTTDHGSLLSFASFASFTSFTSPRHLPPLPPLPPYSGALK